MRRVSSESELSYGGGPITPRPPDEAYPLRQSRHDDVEEDVLLHLKGGIADRLATHLASGAVDYLAAHDSVTSDKLESKVYARHSGYPQGLKQETLGHLLERRPEEVIRRAQKLPGIIAEPKGPGLAVHYRLAPHLRDSLEAELRQAQRELLLLTTFAGVDERLHPGDPDQIGRVRVEPRRDVDVA